MARGRLRPSPTTATLPTLLPLLWAPTPPPLSSLTPSPPSPCPTPSTPSLPSSPATPQPQPPPLSPPLALLPPPSPLSEGPTPVLDVTSLTPLEPSMLPRGRLRLTPTTMEDTTDVDTDSATGATDTVSDTAVDTTWVRFCQDVLDLDATSLPTFCPWIGSRGISNLL